MRGGLRWAVTDGPDGTAAVALPDDAAAALVARERHVFDAHADRLVDLFRSLL